MATLSSLLAWEIPWTEEPGRLQSIASQRVGHDWVHIHPHGCESWTIKKAECQSWCFLTVLENTLESPLDCKEIKSVNPKGNQSQIFIGMTNGEAETPILRPADRKWWFTGKNPDAGRDWRQEEKGVTEDEMVRWIYRIKGHEFEQFLGNRGQECQSCCRPWGDKKSDMTEQEQSLIKLFL